MDFREARRGDIEEIQAVAHASLDASYGHVLDEDLISEAVSQWYGTDQLGEDLSDEDTVFIVAVEDGGVAGFAQSYVVARHDPVGEIDWLHVSPDHRGEGLGSQLLKRVELALLERGVTTIEAEVLAANEAGAEFYDEQGYTLTEERDVEIGGETFVEEVFAKFPDESGSGQVLMERRVGPDERPLYVAYDERERGSDSPFYTAYSDSERQQRYGFFCSNCGGFDTAIDAMGRVECNECGNRRKATRWDSSYL